MSFAAELAAIASRLSASTVPLSWEAFGGPAYVPPAPAVGSTVWGRPSVAAIDSGRVTAGVTNARRRRTGTLYVALHAPKGAGFATLTAKADEIANLFRDYQSGGLSFGEPLLALTPPDPAEAWQQAVVRVNYYADEIV